MRKILLQAYNWYYQDSILSITQRSGEKAIFQGSLNSLINFLILARSHSVTNPTIQAPETDTVLPSDRKFMALRISGRYARSFFQRWAIAYRPASQGTTWHASVWSEVGCGIFVIFHTKSSFCTIQVRPSPDPPIYARNWFVKRIYLHLILAYSCNIS